MLHVLYALGKLEQIHLVSQTPVELKTFTQQIPAVPFLAGTWEFNP